MKHNARHLFNIILAVLILSSWPAAQITHADETTAEASGGGFGQQAIQIARSYTDGGGYIWKGSTGVSETLTFDGQTLMEKQPVGTYCCGFTLQVAFKLAQNNNLFDGKTFDQIKQFQVQWYGSTKDSAETQCTLAMTTLGVGQPVKHDDARPGDFANFWRTKSGHSVIFLNWITDDQGKRIGLNYRSSQTKTNGIGDNSEYFKNHGGEVDPDRLYLCRFNEPEPKPEDDAEESGEQRRGANR
jgi:hypothetical protein